jgi:hypothetical protein
LRKISSPGSAGLAVEIHEDWLEAPRYLNMEALREQRKTELAAA